MTKAEIENTIKALVGSLPAVQGEEQNMNLRSLSAIYALQQEVAELTGGRDEAMRRMRQLFKEGDRLCEDKGVFGAGAFTYGR